VGEPVKALPSPPLWLVRLASSGALVGQVFATTREEALARGCRLAARMGLVPERLHVVRVPEGRC
jgi:hypothetical protein